MYYLFPFHLVEKNSNIVLYGAGNAGKNFAKQVAITGHCNIVAVVDKNYEKAQVRDIPVYSPEWLCVGGDFDKLVITIVNEKTHNQIKDYVVTELKVPEEKIVSFISPVMDWDNPNRAFFDQKDEYELTKKLGNYLEEIDPKLLLTSERIDVIVRYLFFNDLMNDIENKEHLSLFSRFTMARTYGHEAPGYFSGAGKNSVQEFVDKGKALCRSIKEEGFKGERFIPLGNNRRPYDGLHRLAAAIAAGEKVYVHDYSNRDAFTCDMKWFREQGFSFEDRLKIVRGFADVYPGKCGMFVLYAPYSNLWEYMEGQISQHFKVVETFDFHYEDNYIAFENVLRQIYWDWNQYSEWLTRKLEMLSLAPLMYRVIVVSDEKGNEDFYGEMARLKKQLRESLFADIDGRVPIQLHSSDNEDEFNHLKKIFLSDNQYKWDMRKTNQYYRGWFLGALEKLKQWCASQKIPLDDVCVVGSGVMELYGLREARNINFVIKDADLSILDADLEQKNDYAYLENGSLLSNDILISDPTYHTVFSDLKFCNPEFVYRRKKMLNREKDQWDLKRLEDWKNLVIGMEDRRFLNQQVQRELYKRGLIK